MLLMRSLVLKHLVRWLLSEQLHCESLVFKSKVGSAALVRSLESVSYTTRSRFFLLDRSYKLAARLDVDLPSFYDFLEDLCVLLGEYFNLALVVEFSTALAQLVDHVVVVALHIVLYFASWVGVLDFLEMLLVTCHVPQSFELLEDFATQHLNVGFGVMAAIDRERTAVGPCLIKGGQVVLPSFLLSIFVHLLSA